MYLITILMYELSRLSANSIKSVIKIVAINNLIKVASIYL